MKEIIEVLGNIIKWEKGTYYKPGYKHGSNQRERMDALTKSIEVLKRVEDKDGIIEMIMIHIAFYEGEVRPRDLATAIQAWLKSDVKNS